MFINSSTFEHGARIPQRCAFGIPDAENHMALGENRNPQLAWGDVPDNAKSLVLLCVDVDVPSSLDNFNKEGCTISRDLPRVEFINWVMTDIPATDGAVAEGQCSDGITAGGKTSPAGPPGSRQGVNDYTGFMAGDENMKGDYYGYEGPCPPWNDELVHRYHFIVYATDLDSLGLDGPFTAADVRTAMDGHVLAEACLTGLYSLNPDCD
jgi:Raf kinase inhibitor-like YbhB/YbcL family protein